MIQWNARSKVVSEAHCCENIDVNIILISLTNSCVISIFHWRSMLIHKWIWSICRSNNRTIYTNEFGLPLGFLKHVEMGHEKTFWHLVHGLLPFNLPAINKTKTWGLSSLLFLIANWGLFLNVAYPCCHFFFFTLVMNENAWVVVEVVVALVLYTTIPSHFRSPTFKEFPLSLYHMYLRLYIFPKIMYTKHALENQILCQCIK